MNNNAVIDTRWPSGLARWTGDLVVLGSNPAAATSLRNFGNSVFPALPVYFGGDTQSRRSLLSGAYARGSKISHQSALDDKLARQGTSRTQHDEQVSYATSKQIVQTKSRKMWHDRWARGNTGRIYYQHQQTPNQTDPINQLHRAHQTAVFRLRTHHAPLNAHIHRIKKEHPSKCVYCPDSDETVEHFLFHCPLYDNIRSRLLPAQPNIHNTLYGSTTQLQRTATYNMSARTDVTRLSEVWGTKKGKR